MSKILFPTDFSETATNAFVYALNLAQATDAEIFVLNCYEMPVLSTTSTGQPEMVQEVYNSIDRKSTRLNSSHVRISYAVFCLKKKKVKHALDDVGGLG